MKARLMTKGAMAVAALLSPTMALAETYSDTYNGATCISYPPFNSSNALPYRNWLYGFRESAFCHINVPNT